MYRARKQTQSMLVLRSLIVVMRKTSALKDGAKIRSSTQEVTAALIFDRMHDVLDRENPQQREITLPFGMRIYTYIHVGLERPGQHRQVATFEASVRIQLHLQEWICVRLIYPRKTCFWLSV